MHESAKAHVLFAPWQINHRLGPEAPMPNTENGYHTTDVQEAEFADFLRASHLEATASFDLRGWGQTVPPRQES